MEIEPAAVWMDIDSLVPWDQNPRDNDDAVPGVADSIKRFGFASPIIARKLGDKHQVIAGHTRLKAAKTLGIEHVPVRVMDLDPADAKLLALADNKVAEVAEWSDGLGPLLEELRDAGLEIEGLGWSDDELSELLAEPAIDLDGSEDDAPELQDDHDSQIGEVYELGPHRLICGDATDPDIWAKLMGDDKLKCVWTDPPYGVAYVGKTSDALTIDNDDLDDDSLRELLTGAFGQAFEYCDPGSSWYVASPPGHTFYQFATVLRELDVWRHTLAWVKDRFVMGRSDYHYQHEAIFYGWKPGGAHYFVPERTHSTVLEFQRPHANREHPTMKPVALVTSILEKSTKPGWIVGEPFGGSGTTLIASASIGRVARVIELDPRYCDVIRRRWAKWAKDHDRDPGSGALDE